MNIKDFEKYINPKILSRGRDYYKSGYINSLPFIDELGKVKI